MDENRNIPAMSVGDAVNELTMLYAGYINGGRAVNDIRSVFLWGPPGVGKTEGVYQIARRLEKETGKKVNVKELWLCLYTPTDLQGIPMADAQRKFAVWLRPKMLDLDASPDVINLLFLDELSSAPPAIQKLAYQMTLQKRVGEHVFPQNCLVIAAGNRITDKSSVYRMDKALANRLMHFQIQADFESWRRWAINHGVNDKVLGYLSYDNSRLNSEPGLDEEAFPTPRSWVAVSDILNVVKPENVEQLHNSISGNIGLGEALEFEAWCKVCGQLPSPEEVFAGTMPPYPKSPDALYALISAMTAHVQRKGTEISVTALENGCRYAEKFPVDFAAFFFRNLSAIEGMNLTLMKAPSFLKWMKKNRRYLQE